MDYFKVFIALLALINPLGMLPMFISLTHDFDAQQKQRAIRSAALTVVAVIIVCALLGEFIIKFFGISIASLQVAGGLIILLMSFSMINAQTGGTKTTDEERDEAEHKATIGVVPLGIPLLTGPGAMSTVIVMAHNATKPVDYLVLFGSGVLIAALVWFTFQMAEPIARTMGHTGINISTRIMGLLVAAISVEFIVNGLTTLMPALGR